MVKKGVVLFLVVMSFCFVTGCSPSADSAFLTVDESQCIGCAKCTNVCISDAIRIMSNKAVIDLTKCVKCGNCVEICPVNAVY